MYTVQQWEAIETEYPVWGYFYDFRGLVNLRGGYEIHKIVAIPNIGPNALVVSK